MVRSGIKIQKMTEQIIDDNLLDEATEWFVLMRADDISDSRGQAFVQWISQSSLHQEAYAEIGGFWDGLPVLQTKPSVTSLADHKARKTAQKENNPAKNPKSHGWSPRLIAASVAFLIISIIGVRYGDVFLMDHHSTQVGELADIILEDGSHLVLNTNS
ncbi:MAG: DUF4880 domain-containing protein, partial [Emcibacter sp.]|nr:DUF4880 domain-containing protein [Emcibacter sp.]